MVPGVAVAPMAPCMEMAREGDPAEGQHVVKVAPWQCPRSRILPRAAPPQGEACMAAIRHSQGEAGPLGGPQPLSRVLEL